MVVDDRLAALLAKTVRVNPVAARRDVRNPDRRHELGVVAGLLPAHQRSGERPAGRKPDHLRRTVSWQFRQQSKKRYCQIMENLARQGAQGIILGCTVIGLLVEAEDSPAPVFDTTRIHAEAAVEYALA